MKLFEIVFIAVFSILSISCSDDDGKYVQADPDGRYYVNEKEVKIDLANSFISIDDNIYVELNLKSGASHKFSFSGNSQGNVTDRFISAKIPDFSEDGEVVSIKKGKISFDKEFGLGGIKFEDVVFQTNSQEIEISGYAYLNKK